jgi:hypothetical protein
MFDGRITHDRERHTSQTREWKSDRETTGRKAGETHNAQYREGSTCSWDDGFSETIGATKRIMVTSMEANVVPSAESNKFFFLFSTKCRMRGKCRK